MIFKYKAVTDTGETLEGTFEGQNTDEVISMLRGNNYLPISVEELNEREVNSGITLGTNVKKKDMAVFCRQFYFMLNAGISIVNCLDILEKQTENKLLKKAIGKSYEDVQKGMTLSEAMKKHKKIFPILLVNMVEAGEVSGNLDIIMDRMAIHYEKENKIENKVKSAFTYPIILIIVSVAVVIFLLTKVMPTFIGMFESSGSALPGPTRYLLNMSERLENYWFIYAIVIPLVIAGIAFYAKSPSGKMLFDSLKIKLPGLKKTNIKIITSRFTRTLSTLLSSGIPLIQSLEVVSRVVGNVIVAKGLERGIEDIKKGVSLSSTIRAIGVFPPMVYSMINVGEESGSLDEILLKTADFYDEEVETSLEKMTTMLEPILIVIMAFIIGFIVIAMAMPMFDMVNTIEM
ncbi:type II secretion system F family protein [Anaerosalibacter sp. Marseille-P3206]|uniref:type II secretion system F family protein n=1 Tax=Anaerosalibacter sp. Marseille-P3206 TaxID=1871005 RepID=UPI001F2B993C|nr:type II secretion system F family protein [Anaerosalibacter sp. Marseille-P3206]